MLAEFRGLLLMFTILFVIHLSAGSTFARASCNHRVSDFGYWKVRPIAGSCAVTSSSRESRPPQIATDRKITLSYVRFFLVTFRCPSLRYVQNLPFLLHYNLQYLAHRQHIILLFGNHRIFFLQVVIHVRLTSPRGKPFSVFICSG